MRLLFADVPEACDNMMVIATSVASKAISHLVLNGMPRHETGPMQPSAVPTQMLP